MKTFPSDQEYNHIETPKDSFVEANICGCLKIAEKNNPGYGRTKIDDCQNSTESDNLIICNPGLASSFQSFKSEKHKLSPGHYLQKVFLNSVAQKFRSQSLPNCFEKRKLNKSSEIDTSDDISETSIPLVQQGETGVVSVDIKDTVTEGWFKTWPERGVDKISNRIEDVEPDDNISDETENGNIDNLTSCRPRVDDDKLDLFRLPSPTVKIKAKATNCLKECYCTNKRNLSPSTNVEKNPNNLIHDPPSYFAVNSNQTNSKSIPLDDLLDNFPLAYSPVTKQLLLIKSDVQKHENCTSFDNSGNQVVGLYDQSVRKSDEENLNLEGVEADAGKPYDRLGGRVCVSNSRELQYDLPVNNLHHVNTEVSSFSSTVSSLSDNSPSTNEDSALGSLLDHGDTCSLVSLGGCSAYSEDSTGAGSKKKSLTGFLSRNVFNWKSGSRSEDSFGRWRLFGKNTSPLSSQSSLTVDHCTESDGGSVAPDSPSSLRSSGSGARLETRVASSSALIQLDRPANLPAKSEEEQARHRAQYQQMIDAAKKKELKEVKQKKKQMQLQLKAEEQLAQAIRVWTHEILPRWDHMHTSKKARELWWQGVPPCVRGKVWRLAIGNSLNLTQSLYNVYVQRAQNRLQGGGASSEDSDSDNKEASMELIQLDISRTFPHLCIFQQGGPYYDMLHCLLAAYVCYRPDVGYVQGMSFIAAVLILNMEAADAFVCFANLLDRPCHCAFFHLNQPRMQAYYSTYDQLFRENLPQLYAHFTATTLTSDLYLLDWIYTVFTKAMNLDLACRVWDVFLRDGEQFLFRTALGVLHMCQDALLEMDFVRGSQFLTRLPDDLSAEQLFKSISCIRMTTNKQSFQDILTLHSTALGCQ